jgi:hypothetical protein
MRRHRPVSRRLGIALVAITLATAACDLLAVPDVVAPMGVGDFAIVTQPAPPPARHSRVWQRCLRAPSRAIESAAWPSGSTVMDS